MVTSDENVITLDSNESPLKNFNSITDEDNKEKYSLLNSLLFEKNGNNFDDNKSVLIMLKNEENLNEIAVYKRRWAILFIFSVISFLSAFNWIEYCVIQDVIIFYYNQSLPNRKEDKIDAINWLSMIYMICYIPLVFPAMFLLERKGLKLCCILGAFMTFMGSITKCFAVKSDLFLIAFTGQTFCAIGQAFILGIPPRLSSLWFSPDQIGLATSIGVFGNQLGTAFGFVIPPNVIIKNEPISIIEKKILVMLIIIAAVCGLFLFLTIKFITDQPEKPPSLAQLEIRNKQKNEIKNKDFLIFKRSLIKLLRNVNFYLILISYGINAGIYYSISTLLNLIITNYHNNENEKIGIIGLIIVLSGLLGAVLSGILLDRTKAFKLIAFLNYAFSFGAMLLFAFSLNMDIYVIFFTSFLLGFFMTAYLPIGFELAAELTFPIPEGSSSGLLNCFAQIFGIIFTFLQGRIIFRSGVFIGNLFLLGALFIGIIITIFIKPDYKRQNAMKTITEKIQPNKKL